MESKLKTIISELTELYQPIFKHPNLSKNVSRLCDDRLVVIERAYDAIAKELGRPLSVLDLGCAQGYFSLNLASKGAKVLGIDYEKNNI